MQSEKQIEDFCSRYGLTFKWQPTKYDGRRAVIKSTNRKHHHAIIEAANRLKGVHISEWFCDIWV